MFTIGIIALIISVIGLASIAFFGILQYKDSSWDDDSDKTVKDLFKIMLGLCIGIILSVGIMGYSYYTEKPNVEFVQIEETK